MAAAMTIALLCLLAAAAASAQGPQNGTAAQEPQGVTPDFFVYNPVKNASVMATLNSTMAKTGGASMRRTVKEFPGLKGNGLSQTSFTLGPCAVRVPHSHPRASGLLYVVHATNLTVGFVTEDGQLIQNNINTSASAIFPQGLVHFQQNNDCQPAKFIITYNDEAGATVNTVPALLATGPEVFQAAMGVNSAQYNFLQSHGHSGVFVPGPADCTQRCSSTGSAAQQAPSSAPSGSAVGAYGANAPSQLAQPALRAAYGQPQGTVAAQSVPSLGRR